MTETNYCKIDYSTVLEDGEQIWACNYHDKVFSDAEGREKILCNKCKTQMIIDIDEAKLFCEKCD